MMNFPTPTFVGQVFNPGVGPIYTWDGTAWNLTPIQLKTAQARNRITNPSMQINQELGLGATMSTNNGYVCDQWMGYWVTTGAPVLGHRQEAPSAHKEVDWFVRFSSTTADASLAATEYYTCATKIEGNNVADLKWGTPYAVPAIIRFMARSTIAGSFGVRVAASGSTPAYFVKLCTITTPNQWTLFEFVVPPPAIGTAIPTDNTAAIGINITAMSGANYNGGADGVWSLTSYLTTPAQTNWMSVAGQLLEFTNVGLYVDYDSTGIAPAYELPEISEELARCQRYYCKTSNIWQGQVTTGNSYAVNAYLPTQMRVGPTCSGIAGGAGSFPAAVGTITTGGYNSIQESRVANATVASAYYGSTLIANARM